MYTGKAFCGAQQFQSFLRAPGDHGDYGCRSIILTLVLRDRGRHLSCTKQCFWHGKRMYCLGGRGEEKARLFTVRNLADPPSIHQFAKFLVFQLQILRLFTNSRWAFSTEFSHTFACGGACFPNVGSALPFFTNPRLAFSTGFSHNFACGGAVFPNCGSAPLPSRRAAAHASWRKKQGRPPAEK